MRTTAVVIGAGHCGLAMSKCLSDRSIDHVVLERGEIANSWRTERWDSLRLLTPNWLTRLPGYAYQGNDADGYMNMPELIGYLDGYAATIAAPVRTNTEVSALDRVDGIYRIKTNQGEWEAQAVILATGANNVPSVPPLAADVPSAITQLTPHDYRNPDQLDQGGVLVVGASATGSQLAGEIHASGRPVTLSVGEHVRAPRIYRGLDVLQWMEISGMHHETYEEVEDLVRARRIPAFQLTGSDDRINIDLNSLIDSGISLRGRLAAVREGRALFSGSLRNVCALADLKLGRLLDTFDEWAVESGMDAEVDPPERYEPTRLLDDPPLELDLTSGEVKTIVWATGFRPDYSWLDLDVLDRKGMIRHDGGVVGDAPGMYLMGMPFLRKRKSSLIDGAGDDAGVLTSHLISYLEEADRS
jgi:putative flavoprotein involved in K+ transport